MPKKIANYKKLLVKTCPYCEEIFETFHRRQIYCAPLCRQKHRERTKEEAKPRGKPKQRITHRKICPQCENEFTFLALPHHSHRQKFCSKKCHYASIRHTKRQPRQASAKLTQTELLCLDFLRKQLNLHSFEVFTDNLIEDYHGFQNKELFHEWAIYSIIFTAHLLYKYDTIMSIPGFDKPSFMSLCENLDITLQDSPQFAHDMTEFRNEMES